jgi:putative protease
MKSPAYVGYVTKLYRMLIDKYYNGEEFKLTVDEVNNLKKLFNREFTDGYLFNDKDVMNIKTPNHQGI